MCIIIAKPEGVPFPTLETLKICNTNNDDGCGLAYHKKGGKDIRIKKDFLDVDTMWQFITENMTDEDSAIIHFRLATSGLVDFGNRHPFPVTDKDEELRNPDIITDMAVAHNGVFSRWNSQHGDLSDTQHFIKNVLSDKLVRDNMKGNLAIQTLLSDFIGGSKLAILNDDGSLSVWGHFVKDNGLYYSNTSYQTARITYANVGNLGYYQQQDIWNNEEDYATNPYNNEKAEELCESCVDKIAIYILNVDGSIWPVCQECKDAIETSYTRCECGNYTDYDYGVCEPCLELHPEKWDAIVHDSEKLSENG